MIDDEEGIQIVWKRLHDCAEVVFRGQLEMDVASDLVQGMTKIKKNGYDAVILDLTLDVSGAERTITFIAEHAEELPPIIVLTGLEDIQVRRRCMMFGASDFWTKTDAQERPDLFFKAVYNQYLRRYADSRTNSPA